MQEKYLTKAVTKFFNHLDQYQQPYFIVIKFDYEKNKMTEAINRSVDYHSDDWKLFELEEDLMFIPVSCSASNIHLTASTICQFLGVDKAIAHLSIVQHNNMEKPKTTFQTCFSLLEELRNKFKGRTIFEVKEFATT